LCHNRIAFIFVVLSLFELHLNVAQTKFEIPYLSFPPPEIDFVLPAEFTLPSRLLPIIVTRRQERTICHILDKFIDKVVAFLRI